MAAGLRTLRNDGIDPALLQPHCLLDGRGRREHLRAPGFHAGHKIRRGQPEMKAHPLWLERLQSIGCRGAERGARTSAGARVRINSELPEVRRQKLAPCRFSRRLARGPRVAKEIDILKLG